MEPKVNYVLVGAFLAVLGAVVLGIVLWLGKSDYRGVYDRYYAYMRESVAGLSVNSTVKYRGVDVGRVKDIVLNPENPEEVRLTLDILMARLAYALERAKQLHQTHFAVLCLDLGQSNKINYLFGSEYNKRVLQESAALLKTILRPTDTIARFGGDEFLILIEDVGNLETPIRIASRVQNRIRKYLAASENELQVRANVGVVLCGEEYASVEKILQDAEAALELAKSNRRKMLQSLRSKPMSAATTRVAAVTGGSAGIGKAIRRGGDALRRKVCGS